MVGFNKTLMCLSVLAVLCCKPASAEVLSSGANGFEVRETAHVAAASDKAYAALLQPARWWNSEHTFPGTRRIWSWMRAPAAVGARTCRTAAQSSICTSSMLRLARRCDCAAHSDLSKPWESRAA